MDIVQFNLFNSPYTAALDSLYHTIRIEMSRETNILTILLSSPNDVSETEIQCVKKAVYDWNRRRQGSVSFDLITGVENSHSELNIRPQAAVNHQVTSKVDCVFAIFADRLGTPTGESESGTAEEVKFASETGKFVSVARSLLPRKPLTNPEESQQLQRLIEYLEDLGRNALLATYSNLEELSDLTQKTIESWAEKFIENHVSRSINGLVTQNNAGIASSLKDRIIMENCLGSWLKSKHGKQVLDLLRNGIDHINYPGWLIDEAKRIYWNADVMPEKEDVTDQDIKEALSLFLSKVEEYSCKTGILLFPNETKDGYYEIPREWITSADPSKVKQWLKDHETLRELENELYLALNELHRLYFDRFEVLPHGVGSGMM